MPLYTLTPLIAGIYARVDKRMHKRRLGVIIPLMMNVHKPLKRKQEHKRK